SEASPNSKPSAISSHNVRTANLRSRSLVRNHTRRALARATSPTIGQPRGTFGHSVPSSSKPRADAKMLEATSLRPPIVSANARSDTARKGRSLSTLDAISLNDLEKHRILANWASDDRTST